MDMPLKPNILDDISKDVSSKSVIDSPFNQLTTSVAALDSGSTAAGKIHFSLGPRSNNARRRIGAATTHWDPSTDEYASDRLHYRSNGDRECKWRF